MCAYTGEFRPFTVSVVRMQSSVAGATTNGTMDIAHVTESRAAGQFSWRIAPDPMYLTANSRAPCKLVFKDDKGRVCGQSAEFTVVMSCVFTVISL